MELALKHSSCLDATFSVRFPNGNSCEEAGSGRFPVVFSLLRFVVQDAFRNSNSGYSLINELEPLHNYT